MLTIYHSNQLDLLKSLAATLMNNQPLQDPFQSEVILVQNNSMAQWMKIELATQFGIVANIEFLLPVDFIWQIFIRVLPNIPEERDFSKPAMTWRLMSLLPHLSHQSEFTFINTYLRFDNDKRKCFQFATQMADLFDKYLIFRPDWLERWQHYEIIDGIGDAQYWQAPLWRAMISKIAQTNVLSWNRANLCQYFIKTMKQYQKRPSGLPDRIFVYGISAIAPIYLQVLQALGHHIDVHLFFTNPCRYYWGDIHDRSFLTQLLQRNRKHYQYQIVQPLFLFPNQAEALFNEHGEQQIVNPLLSSWGKQGKDNLYLLSQLENITEVDAFIEPTGNYLLNLVQKDILLLKDRTI